MHGIIVLLLHPRLMKHRICKILQPFVTTFMTRLLSSRAKIYVFSDKIGQNCNQSSIAPGCP
jgi:hypothetical protein